MENLKKTKKTGKKWILGLAITLVIAAVAAGAFTLLSQGKSVDFRVLNEKSIPKDIANDIIPEYRTLERALACMVDDKVYVIVTRGEKPASGYKVDIDKIKIETESEKEILIVHAVFKDPAKGNSMSQILTYPVKVVETELKTLPDEIELRVRYEE